MHGRATSWKTRRSGGGSSRWNAVLKVLCDITIQKKQPIFMHMSTAVSANYTRL
jgi:hypothetical protein